MKVLRLHIPILVAWMLTAVGAHAGVWETDFKVRVGALTEGQRQLDEVAEGFVDFQPVLYWRSDGFLAAMGRGQALAPTGDLLGGDQDTPSTDEAFLRLRELWVAYSGLSSYPGESIRFGLQRLREPDGLWFDQDIEAMRWIFDTTLVQAEAGLAHSLSSWRTDENDLPADLRDRLYLFGGIGGQWRPGHFTGLRAALASDRIDPEDEISEGVDDPKLSKRQFTWIDLYGHNGYFQPPAHPGWFYWGNLSLVNGWREDHSPAAPERKNRESVFGWAADVGLRWTLPLAKPWQVGLAYAYASGGHEGEVVDGYEQTGLQSNRSRYTGTRSLLYRFNEALRADLNNLRVASAYVSVPRERFDVSLVYHHFVRNRDQKSVITNGLDIQPEPGGSQLGEGLDLVAAYYFGAYVPTLAREDENLRSSVRLRTSVFHPGSAYDAHVDDQLSIGLEAALWF